MRANYEPISKDRVHLLDLLEPTFDYKADVYPGYDCPLIFSKDDHIEWRQVKFGMIPPWNHDLKFSKYTYNARTETVDKKPSFRHAWAIKTNFKFFIRNLKHYHLLIEESKSSEIKIKVLEDSFEKITDITNYSMIPTNELAEFNNLCGKAYEEYFRLQNLIDDNEIYKILKSLKV